MINTKATANEPLKFFEDFFLFGGLQRFKADFFEYWSNQEKEHYLDATVFELFDCVQVVSIRDEFGKPTFKMMTVSEEIETKLENEFQIAKRYLMESISEHISKFNDANRKIMLWSTGIQEMYDQNAKVFKEYPVCVTYLNKLLVAMNSRLVDAKGIPTFEIPLVGQNLIKDLFGFLPLRRIIQTAEYNRLQSLLSKFLKDFSAPELKESDKIDIKDENKSIVRFCLYLLYKSVPRSRGKQENFVLFLDNVFINFKGDLSTKNHFAHIPPRYEDWYPELAKKKIEENNA
jgi:hypothetical protein